ncbi:MAG: tRNA dihydrouridine synthase DusB [Bacteroidales bacterium]
MQIGTINLGNLPLFLAPMEDVTDESFRFVCKMFGADMMYTEFVSSDGLIRDAAKTLQKLVLRDEERPIGIQLYGHDMAAMTEAARRAELALPDVIDLNFGCPVRKIANRGAGAGMLCNVPLMVEMTAAIVKAVKVPVTVKTRLGWDDSSKNIVEVAERLQDVGIQAITIHGRTRSQMYKGEADWTLIGEVKNNSRMQIPVIGNGDISSPRIAFEMANRYGVDGLMIGRATYGRPWIFKEIKSYLREGRIISPPTVAERVSLAKMHLLKSVEVKGLPTGILEMRRHLAHYFKGLPHFKEFRMKLVTLNEADLLIALLDQIAIHYQGYEWPDEEVVSPLIH